MKRKAQKNQSAHSRQWLRGLRLRSHAPAEGFAARKQRNIRKQSTSLDNRCSHGRLCRFRTVWSLRTLLHVEKLITECGNAALEKPHRDRCHKRMGHARPCAMCQDIAGARVLGSLKNTGNAVRVAYPYANRLWL